jgi:Tol biopolymer transport system component/DNA-binding winged helix-turn-helix (wHTH) protein
VVTDPKIRFGAFELNRTTGELRKHGVKVPLSGQPLEVLALLAARAGQVVTRNELKEALWPQETFVDFDNGVNSAIRRIRRALDDSATDPRYIETLPKRGYRFVGGVAGTAAPGDWPAMAGVGTRKRLWLALGAVLALAFVLVWLRSPNGTTSEEITVGQPVRLTTLPGIEQSPTFSPDGSQVAFAWNGVERGDFDIYMKPVSGAGQPLQLTDHRADDIMPTWSPDGQTIAYWRSNGDRSGIYLVDPTGTSSRKLFDDRPTLAHNWIQESQLSWSPDGKWIAFTDTNLSPPGISALSIGTGEIETHSEAAGIGDYFPAFSPDGTALAWTRIVLGPRSEIEGVFVKRLHTDLTARLGTRANGGLAWTSNSSSLVAALMERRLNQSSIAIVDASTGEYRNLSGAGMGVKPAIAGARLAFGKRTLNIDVIRVDLSGAAERPAQVLPSTLIEFAAQVSPDGSRIVLASQRSGRTRLYTVNADGSDLIEVSPFGGAPRWSPDGSRIAFDGPTPEQKGYGVYIVDSDGGRVRLLTDLSGTVSQPCWSEDGQTVYFADHQSPNTRFWRLPSEGGVEPEILTGEAGQRCWVQNGWLYFGRDDGVWRIREDDSGEKEPILEGRLFPDSGHWQVLRERLYFIDFAEGWETGRWALKRLDLETRQIADVVALPLPPARINGLSVSPDESWFVYTVDNMSEQDLMMIEEFE